MYYHVFELAADYQSYLEHSLWDIELLLIHSAIFTSKIACFADFKRLEVNL